MWEILVDKKVIQGSWFKTWFKAWFITIFCEKNTTRHELESPILDQCTRLP